MDIDAGSFPDEDSLEALQHLQDVDWVHAAVLVVITKLEHNCRNKKNSVKQVHKKLGLKICAKSPANWLKFLVLGTFLCKSFIQRLLLAYW